MSEPMTAPADGGTDSFASELRRRRESAGLSMAALSRLSGVPISTVWRLEQGTATGGRHLPQAETALRLDEALGADGALEAWATGRQRKVTRSHIPASGGGKPLREMRLAAGLSLGQLSDLSQVSPTSLSRLEAGQEFNPTVGTIAKLERALGAEHGALAKAFALAFHARLPCQS